MSKHALFFWVGSVLIIVSAGFFYLAVNYYPNEYDYSGEEAANEYQEAAAIDTYGGSTPEETFNLFIAALRADDPALAAKYFVPDKNSSWDKWTETLAILKENNALREMADSLEISDLDIIYDQRSKVWKIKGL
ncbi:MAG: hypothetical protein A3B99_03210 [Candidatus Yanofskybacteria bacterium RIFCSPHIGHO2_02_FULL_44_12b]|uniref:DUF4878 domain-containing protein n=2 Tax=Candidatus Yanofskyibacteriota TaxID=1752733 RepID=A0A1F8GJG6_9BACT|nr:MAG: hypothetical protein UW79_C0004G0047 [Candidatus Yanofskybacteria bacterium GW2011_GWA2_44_9]OGN05315.1 MAG: hypothetical protein A2659_01785 [Candidatus Yanofskybacteria bacterium RIFCSPHIGHO2_01_FULL_44_24]OGN16295.1 MAG: hypothetical protein A3B99_03210 [Candidatus Yanofskybacteria bacterium RIFCSPHIGHO2_02_FULL_44_12b]OGN25545.1 MAG: hypothetical protein A2925_02360 [Candidatus Yanofskybacteria bacterium RIFCSPLOWO2_01_FULL_44_22]